MENKFKKILEENGIYDYIKNMYNNSEIARIGAGCALVYLEKINENSANKSNKTRDINNYVNNYVRFLNKEYGNYPNNHFNSPFWWTFKYTLETLSEKNKKQSKEEYYCDFLKRIIKLKSRKNQIPPDDIYSKGEYNKGVSGASYCTDLINSKNKKRALEEVINSYKFLEENTNRAYWDGFKEGLAQSGMESFYNEFLNCVIKLNIRHKTNKTKKYL